MYKGAVAPKTALPYGRDSCICNGIAAIRHTRCQKLFLFSLSVAKQADSAENAQKKVRRSYGR